MNSLYTFCTNVILYKATLLKKIAYGMFGSMAAAYLTSICCFFQHGKVNKLNKHEKKRLFEHEKSNQKCFYNLKESLNAKSTSHVEVCVHIHPIMIKI